MKEELMTTTDALMAQMAQQLADLMNAFEAQRMQTGGKGGGGVARKRIEGRHIRVQEFTGKPEEWNDWAFTFKRSIRAQSKVAFDLMSRVEVMEEELD